MMRRLGIAVIVLLHFALQAGAGSQRGLFRYVSPEPGSTMVSRWTNIILRPAPPQGFALDVRGSLSGRHAGNVVVSDDGETSLFLPARPFAPGESVVVTAEPGLRFTFTIAASTPLPPSRAVRARGIAGNDAPLDLPPITVTTSVNPAPGYLFLSNMTMGSGATNIPYILILDNAGNTLYSRATVGECTDFKPQPNGLLTYMDDGLGCFLALDSTFAVVDTFRSGNGYATDWHELRLLPNGHALILGDEYRTVRMDTVVPNGYPSATVKGIVIQELDKSKNVVFQWRTFDHFRITDATHEDLTAGWIDYVHSNAIEQDADGNLLLSSRHMDEITKINRQTGEIIWRWGGKNNQFTFVNDTLHFMHQHAIRRLPGGTVTLFDNGDFRLPLLSRGVEYALDEAHRTATLVWQYRATPDIYSAAMGYTQRLPGGNTLICWGSTNPTLTEVTPAGTIAFQLTFPAGVYTYRAYKFVWKPAVTSAAPGGRRPGQLLLGPNYPNPFNPTTTIPYELPAAGKVLMRVYDVLGREVARPVDQWQEEGKHAAIVDGARFASGVYFCRLEQREKSAMIKIITVK